jgi:hypothetical protein
LEEGCRDIVSHELEDSVEGEEEEVVVSYGSEGGLGVSGGRNSFHSAETGGHSLEAVVWEELELEEHEEPEEDGVWGDVGLVDERESFVSDEHLG